MHNLLNQIDHITYAGKFENRERFIQKWSPFGFRILQTLKTIRHPAEHIALTCDSHKSNLWAMMTGLSISEDPHSAINEFVRRYGEGIQHTAYNVNISFEMDEVYTSMKKMGWEFMTPILTYQDSNGAKLKQVFIAPTVPYGTFIEFVQRMDDQQGKPYNGFDTVNIDDLYDHYVDYSKSLLKR